MHWESGAFVGRCTMILPMAHKTFVPVAKRARIAERAPPLARPAKAEPSPCKEEPDAEIEKAELSRDMDGTQEYDDTESCDVHAESMVVEPTTQKEELATETSFVPPPPE